MNRNQLKQRIYYWEWLLKRHDLGTQFFLRTKCQTLYKLLNYEEWDETGGNVRLAVFSDPTKVRVWAYTELEPLTEMQVIAHAARREV